MPLSDCSFSETSLIWQYPGREVPCGIHDGPGMFWIDCISSTNVVSDGVAAVMSVWGLKTAGTIDLLVPYYIAFSRMTSATSPHHRWVNSSTLTCFCPKLCMWCCNILEIVPITQPGLSLSPSLPSAVSSSTSSLSAPSSTLVDLGKLLRLSPTPFRISSNVFPGFWGSIPPFQH